MPGAWIEVKPAAKLQRKRKFWIDGRDEEAWDPKRIRRTLAFWTYPCFLFLSGALTKIDRESEMVLEEEIRRREARLAKKRK